MRKQDLVVAATVLLLGLSPVSATNDLKTFKNERYQTSFQYPSTWDEKRGDLSGGRVVDAFVDPDDPDTSVSVVISPVPGDFTRLTSFGVDNIRDYVIPKGEGISTSLLSEKVKGEAFYAEYILTIPDAPERHIFSVFALRPQESVVGLTIQTKESSFDAKKDLLKAIVPSFKYIE